MKRTKIADVLTSSKTGEQLLVKGWVRSFRANRFIALNDGSTINNLQAVVDFENFDEAILKKISTGASLALTGVLVESQGSGQAVEMQVSVGGIEILGEANPDDVQKTVMQPKKHSLEFLREQAHLRFRTNTFGAVFRIRHGVAYAIHKFFNDRGFYYIHTPIITGSDAEGAGEMFQVTNLNLYDLPVIEYKGKQPRFTEVFEATKEIAGKYSNCIIDFLEKENHKYYSKDAEFIKNSSILSELFSQKNLKQLLSSDLRQLTHIKQNFDSNFKDLSKEDRDEINELFSKLFLKIKVYFREGKLGNYDLRRLKNDLKKVEKEKGWKFNFDESHFQIDEMPLFILSFYNLFKVYNHDYIDYSEDFFGKQVNLTVSGQLEAELAALALGQVYTFGPTFRAENSNTSRHLAEFWMIEPEVAFNDIHDNMDLAEDMLKYICQYVMDNFADDLKFLSEREATEQQSKPVNERSEMTLLERLQFVVANEFKRMTYTEAIAVLMNSDRYKKQKFQYDVSWGTDLQSEHERYLVEKEFKRPVILTDYPASFKAFYMRQNENCEPGKQTVAAMDILFPGIGEMVGGSQREERLNILEQKCDDFNIPKKELKWYLETRKFGTVPHAGFGLGFERMVMFVTGMGNIRDVIPFPRTPKNAEF